MKLFLINQGTCTRVKLFGIDVKNNFLANGHTVCKKAEDAELIVVNTCSFIKPKEDYFVKMLKQLQAEKLPEQKLMIIGCLASTNRDVVQTISPDILCYGRDIDAIKKDFGLVLTPKVKASCVSDKLSFGKQVLHLFNRFVLRSPHIEYRLKRNKVCYLQISTGCTGKCAYCSERFTTVLKSRTIDEIVQAILDGLQRGYKLFALNSDDASAYGKDIGTNLEALLESVVKLTQQFYITIPEFNPNGITPAVKELLKNKKFLYITVPIQSGSQPLLNAMRRPYQIDKVLQTLKEIKCHNKKLKVNTHIIVGLPGETEQDFALTVQALKTGLFDRVKVFKFSSRPNTEAQAMPNHIAEEVKAARAKKLLQVVKRLNLKHFSLTNLILNREQLK